MRNPLGCGVVAVMVLVGLGLLPAPAAGAEALCALARYCQYEAPAFTLRVVDRETGQPLADVHGLAEWVQYGLPGQYPPLMVLDAVSGPDGVLSFPAWGPIQGSRLGLFLGRDPVITFFKPGYVLIPPRGGTRREIGNIYPLQAEETDRVHRFGEDGKTFEMEPFRGTPEEWLKELGAELTFFASVGLADKRPLLNRVLRIWAEREKYPARYQEPGEFFWHVGRELKDLEGEGR
jgi:hypothetical protein